MKNQKGFSLVELLVVVIIIAIVAAIAIPNLLSSRRTANEASAINSLRTYHSAEATYQALSPGNIYGDEAALLGQGLVDAVLGTDDPEKSGYDLALSTEAAGATYCATATPTAQGSTGSRVYGVSSAQGGVIYQSSPSLTSAAPGDAPTCGAGIFDPNGSGPIGGAAPVAP